MTSYITSTKKKVHFEINTFKMIKLSYWIIAGIMLGTEQKTMKYYLWIINIKLPEWWYMEDSCKLKYFFLISLQIQITLIVTYTTAKDYTLSMKLVFLMYE